MLQIIFRLQMVSRCKGTRNQLQARIATGWLFGEDMLTFSNNLNFDEFSQNIENIKKPFNF